MVKHPAISYTHVLSELSVNRKDPCEIIRELISNSYDAKASVINIYPLLQYEGLIFFDNGMGLSETESINDITPYEAFFSIGKSTKTTGEAIGYKCQGSKLCFASRKITLITRCSGDSSWRTITIDNPRVNLNEQYNIESRESDSPWDTLVHLHNIPDERTSPILHSLNRKFFEKSFSTGAMIIIHGLEVDDFSSFYDANEDDLSYIKNYIRFNTKHGDMRILNPQRNGFSRQASVHFKATPGYDEKCNLSLWVKDDLKKIESGYPYLPKLDETLTQPKNPTEVARLRDGQFFSRSAETISVEGRTYCLGLNRETELFRLEGYLKQQEELKLNIQDKERFMVQDIPFLEGRWLISPSVGEEHWVGALYTLFSHLVPRDSEFSHLWLRPRTFSGVGVDSLAVQLNESSLDTHVHQALEYKYTISSDAEFNHPFMAVNQVVCWDMEIPEQGTDVRDAYEYFGKVYHSDSLDDTGYEITEIQNRGGQVHDASIQVMSLKKLITKTFSVKWFTPPPRMKSNGKQKRH